MITSVPKEKILIVDDEELIRRSIRRKLIKEGYSCAEASCGDEALTYLHTNQADLVILDVKMPGKSGADVLPEIKMEYPDTAVVMATAVNDSNTIISCMKNGAHDYLPKPFALEELMLAVGNALIKRRLEVEIKGRMRSLEITVNDQGKQIRKLSLGSFEVLVNALEAKDAYTAGHSRRVAEMAEAVGRELGLSPADLDNLRWGALLHDVGKIAVDPAIQNKPSQLTPEEYRHVMIHAQIGPGIVEPVANPAILEIIRHHHDRYDGQRPEQSKKGTDIPLGARIVALADTYDAMTSDRPYRPSNSMAAACLEIERCSGSQFDPQITSIFLSIIKKPAANLGNS